LQFIWHYIDVAEKGVTFWPTRYVYVTDAVCFIPPRKKITRGI